ncbi:MAG: hypothetical protein KC615_06800 [Anaerolineae bacterium]|nr:hypothetical protein [Anaerolineae bacterium]
MTEQYNEMMQERLDGNLDEQRESELIRHLQEEPDAAMHNASLEAVHDMLVRAPLVRAPGRLAATIMARLAQAVQEEAVQQELSEEVKQALLFATNLVILQMTPVLLASSYMVMNAQARPEVLAKAVNRTVALVVVMIDGMRVLFDRMEELVDEDPAMAPVALALMPTVMNGILDYMQNGANPLEDVARQVEGASGDDSDDIDYGRIGRLSR